MTVRVVMDPDGVAKLHEAADTLLTHMGHLIAEDMRRYCPVDTGALKAGIHAEDAHQGLARVISGRHVPGDDPKVPLYVEYGTGPHEIRPNSKKALSWPGAAHPVKVVHHPGTRAQPYIRPAVYQQRHP